MIPVHGAVSSPDVLIVKFVLKETQPMLQRFLRLPGVNFTLEQEEEAVAVVFPFEAFSLPGTPRASSTERSLLRLWTVLSFCSPLLLKRPVKDFCSRVHIIQWGWGRFVPYPWCISFPR